MWKGAVSSWVMIFWTMLLNCVMGASTLDLRASARETLVVVEPDDYAVGTDISTAVPGILLSAFGTEPDFGFPLLSNKIRALLPHNPEAPVPTGELVLGMDTEAFETGFFAGGHQFRADFSRPTSLVAIQMAPDDPNGPDFALIQIFGTNGNLLDSFTTLGGATNVAFSRLTADISYMIATNPPGDEGD